jgi:hypothetical protein
VRKFQRNHAVGRQENLHPPDEVVKVGNLSQDVVAQQQIRRLSRVCEFASRFDAEELDERGHAFFDGDFGDVSRGFDAQGGNLARNEMLEQIAVVAGDFDHVTLAMELKTLNHPLCVNAGVFHPAIGIGREIGVIAEDMLRANISFQLHQEALLADEHTQWIERLHLVELIGAQVTLTQRRHAEVDQGVPDWRLAEATK